MHQVVECVHVQMDIMASPLLILVLNFHAMNVVFAIIPVEPVPVPTTINA